MGLQTTATRILVVAARERKRMMKKIKVSAGAEQRVFQLLLLPPPPLRTAPKQPSHTVVEIGKEQGHGFQKEEG